nr:DciA family protein [uncultured Holophaga sp.]
MRQSFRPPSRSLIPIREAGLKGPDAQEARIEAKLRRVWPMVVGLQLAQCTRLIRVRRGTLLVGSWQMGTIPQLRKAAADTWPEVQKRLLEMFKIRLMRIEIVPCDPPSPAPMIREPEQDPLIALFELLKRRREEGRNRG